MRSKLPLALLKASILASMALSLAGCAGTPQLLATLDAVQCLPLIPPSYSQPVASVPLPGPTVGEIATALDGQTARLDLANQHTTDVIQIVSLCDAQQAKIRAALAPKKPWWRPF